MTLEVFNSFKSFHNCLSTGELSYRNISFDIWVLTDTQNWQYWYYYQLCIPIYLQFASLFCNIWYPDSVILGFNPLLRHRFFLSIGTHCYIWHLVRGFINLSFVWSEVWRHTFPKRGWMSRWHLGVLSGRLVMMLTWIVRDLGLVPHWGTDFSVRQNELLYNGKMDKCWRILVAYYRNVLPSTTVVAEK